MNGTLGTLSATVYEQSLIRYYVRPEHAVAELWRQVPLAPDAPANEPHYFGPLVA